MLVLITYDVNTISSSGQKRLRKVSKICQNYGQRVQNSVFEGEISKANYTKLKIELSRIINPEEDSVVLYVFRSTRYSTREEMGLKKGGDENIL